MLDTSLSRSLTLVSVVCLVSNEFSLMTDEVPVGRDNQLSRSLICGESAVNLG